jgi:TNF receptor-associated protein 1
MQSRWIRAIKVRRPVANPNMFCAGQSLLQASNMQRSSVNARIQNVMTTPVSWKMQRMHDFSSETKKSPETMSFQAETRKLLDIVTHSIYSDKEVFIRELISNANDALEKLRYSQVKGSIPSSPSHQTQQMKIEITTDKANRTLTIVDTGIGMTREELISNLGTIARSGSKQFLQQQEEEATGAMAADTGIIGQFGVGFYSSFMVADRVEFESRSALAMATGTDTTNTSPGPSPSPVYKWSSDGAGEFSIEEVSDPSSFPLSHGSRLTLYLKEEMANDWTDSDKLIKALKKHSSFVPFPLIVDGNPVPSPGALWTRDPSKSSSANSNPITAEEYRAFYQSHFKAWDDPLYTLHFRADAPVEVKALLFLPSQNLEKLGLGLGAMGMDSSNNGGVDLYCRKVLIEKAPKDLLPEWLRFVRGVVDSEDLPLALSREKTADSHLIRRLKEVITRKIIRHLSEEMKKDRQRYASAFYSEFGVYLKQGICQDASSMDSLSKLLLFESTKSNDGLISLEEYIANSPPEQKSIFYCLAPNRQAAMASPYLEVFKEQGKDGSTTSQVEVLLVYSTIDEFVMSNLKQFAGRPIVNVESSNSSLPSAASNDSSNDNSGYEQGLVAWLSSTLGPNKVKRVVISKRLKDSPAIITEHESGALRRMMKLVEQAQNRDQGKDSLSASSLPPQVLEVNANHPLLRAMYRASTDSSNTRAASLVAEQLYDNALVAAGLLEDARDMLPRLSELLLAALPQQPQGEEAKDGQDQQTTKSVIEAEVIPPK